MTEKTQHKKVLKDNIEGITKPAIQRLAYAAGVKSMGGLIYEEIRGILRSHLEDVILASVVFMEHSRRTTVQEKDVREALKVLGRPALFGDSQQVKKATGKLTKEGKKIKKTVKQHKQAPTKKCDYYQGQHKVKEMHGGLLTDEFDENYTEVRDPNEIDIAYDVDAKLKYDPYNYKDDPYNQNISDENIDYDEFVDEKEYNPEDDKFPDFTKTWDNPAIFGQTGGAGGKKFKPGMVALRKIRFYQKQPGHCFYIPKAPFNRLIREIAQDFMTNLRFSPDAMMLIHLDAESYIIDLFELANLEAIHAKRVRVQPSDLQMARKLRKEK